MATPKMKMKKSEKREDTISYSQLSWMEENVTEFERKRERERK